MTRYLIDTNIIRFYLANHPAVVEFWEKSRNQGDTFLLSQVTVGELRSQLVELSHHHRSALRRLIKAFPTINSSDIHDNRAHAYRRAARSIRVKHEIFNRPAKPRLPGLADAKIAVDAITEEIPIVTNNTKDFHIARFFGVGIYDPVRNVWFEPIEKTNRSPFFIFPDRYP